MSLNSFIYQKYFVFSFTFLRKMLNCHFILYCKSTVTKGAPFSKKRTITALPVVENKRLPLLTSNQSLTK